jgi:hypothetical protein
MAELFVPIAGMAMIAVIAGLVTRLIATSIHHRTIRAAFRDSPENVPLLAERLEARLPWADALLGWILLAFALSLVVLGVTESDESERMEMLRAAMIPAIVGVVVLGYVRFARPKLPPV